MNKDEISLDEVEITWDETPVIPPTSPAASKQKPKPEPTIQQAIENKDKYKPTPEEKSAFVKAKEAYLKKIESYPTHEELIDSSNKCSSPPQFPSQENKQTDPLKLREKWLKEAAERLYPGVIIGDKTCCIGSISCGYGKGGNRSTKGYSVHMGGNGQFQVFIHPSVSEKDDAIQKIINAFAITQPSWMHYSPSSVSSAMPPYPQVALSEGDPDSKKDTIRQIKCLCPKCGYVARTSRKWLDKVGAPMCPTCLRGGTKKEDFWPMQMVVDGATDNEVKSLVVDVETSEPNP